MKWRYWIGLLSGLDLLLAFNDNPYENRGQEPVLVTNRSIGKEPETF